MEAGMWEAVHVDSKSVSLPRYGDRSELHKDARLGRPSECTADPSGVDCGSGQSRIDGAGLDYPGEPLDHFYLLDTRPQAVFFPNTESFARIKGRLLFGRWNHKAIDP